MIRHLTGYRNDCRKESNRKKISKRYDDLNYLAASLLHEICWHVSWTVLWQLKQTGLCSLLIASQYALVVEEEVKSTCCHAPNVHIKPGSIAANVVADGGIFKQDFFYFYFIYVVFWFKFYWTLSSCLYAKDGASDNLAPNRQLAIIWTNGDFCHRIIYTSPYLNDLRQIYSYSAQIRFQRRHRKVKSPGVLFWLLSFNCIQRYL